MTKEEALLRDFLEQENCLIEFFHNVRHQDTFNSVNNLCIFLEKENYFQMAFQWSLTRQGLEYWSSIADKWQKFLKQHSKG